MLLAARTLQLRTNIVGFHHSRSSSSTKLERGLLCVLSCNSRYKPWLYYPEISPQSISYDSTRQLWTYGVLNCLLIDQKCSIDCSRSHPVIQHSLDPKIQRPCHGTACTTRYSANRPIVQQKAPYRTKSHDMPAINSTLDLKIRECLRSKEYDTANTLINKIWTREVSSKSISVLTLALYQRKSLRVEDILMSRKAMDQLGINIQDVSRDRISSSVFSTTLGQKCCVMLYGYLWAPNDVALDQYYLGLDEDVRKAVDTFLAAACYYSFMHRGSAIQADVSLSLIPSHSARKLLLNGYIHHAPGGHMPQDSKKTSGSEDNALINEIIRRSEFSELEFLETISSTIKLVNDDFNNIKVGGLNRAFLSTLEAGFMPDPRLFKRLLDANCFAYVTLPNNIEDSRCATSSLYAMGETTYGLGQNNIKALALLRSQAYDIDSRIHYDVLCASIKAQDILGSVQVTKASDDSRMVDFLFHQWVNHENALKICSKLIDATVQAPVVAIPQSAHYHIIASLLYIYQSGVHKGHMGRDILALAASLHIKMAPHISDPRLNSIHMLMSALSQEGCLDDLLKISSDLDSRTNWGESCRPNQYTFGILANGLARYGKITDIINITENMVKRGIPVTTQYYAVLIKAFMNCDGSDPHTNTSMGRSQDIKTLHADPTSPTSNLHGHARLPVRKPRPSPESIKAAEAIFFDMKANGFECNEYIYSAMIYGFACAGNSKKAQFYFDNIFEEQKKPGSTIQLNEVIWGSLMYAYVRSRDLKGVLQVWNNAKNWKARQISDANDLKGETQRHSPSFESNHLLNMVMLCLLNLGKPKEALQLFLRSDSSSKSTIANTDRKSQKSHISLAQSLSDPYTLSMVIRAYLQHNEFNKAIEIYKGHRIPWSVRRKKRYDPIKVLSIFARDCIRSDDPNRAESFIKTIMDLGQSPSPTLLLHLLHLFYQKSDYPGVVRCFEYLQAIEYDLPFTASNAGTNGMESNTTLPYSILADPHVIPEVVFSLFATNCVSKARGIATATLESSHNIPPQIRSVLTKLLEPSATQNIHPCI